MSGLPPTAPTANKVKIRSKTDSFKRPTSYEGNANKKESKSLFHNLRKGSSNSKLNEDINDVILEDSEDKTEKNIGRIQGRNFDSDDDDYDLSNKETNVTKMDKIFADRDKVIKNPALIGYLLKYLSSHNIDYNSLLYYLVVQHYKATVPLKEFSKDAPRFANEILTTFVLENSTLKINHKIEILSMLDDLKEHHNLATIFDKSAEEIYNNCIEDHISRLRQSIMHGLFILEVSVDKFKFDAKMNFFNDCIKCIIKELESKLPKETNDTVTKDIKIKIQYMTDVILGVKTSLATIYYYFSKKEKDDNADNVSIVSNRLRTSFLGKSTESLQMMTNCVLDKLPIFSSKVHKKLNSHSFFKKGKPAKGHNFQEKCFEYPVNCILCEKLLWGISPQGFCCLHCQDAAHKNCKDDVHSNCSHKDSKRFLRNTSNITQPIKDNDNKIGNGEDDDISVNSQISSNNINDNKDIQDIKDGMDNENSNEAYRITEKENASISSENSQDVKSNYVVSTATIYVTNTDNGSPINHDEESTCSASEIINELSNTTVESKKEPHSSHVKQIATNYDQKSLPRSQSLRKTPTAKPSEDNVENTTLPRSNKRGSESVYVQDLVANASAWADDPDMQVEETFEANKQLEHFPSHVTKEGDKAEYTRLLVLMEFHHKIKFTVMTLKRFDYLLIQQWPNEEKLLFNTLSLNVIIPLYKLIKTLDTSIEQCKTNKSYSADVAKDVHNWLVKEDESNFQMWLLYSIDLCCTNSLNSVKSSWKEYYRSDPKFAKVLNKRHNKMIMVEQLSNMRPLLFNLPLIVNKIVKDLNKFAKFKEEVKYWKDIYEKFKKLPTFIDKNCMPLVELINNGTILNYFDRTNWLQKVTPKEPYFDYVLDFPRTAFHFNLFDLQEIKISNVRESGKTNKTPAIFVREISDLYAICYDNMLVLLQKENDKYYLKPFKAVESKLNPVFMFENVHASKGEYKGGFYELTLVFIKVAVLTQILFTEKDVWIRWHDFIYQMKLKALKLKADSDNAVQEASATPNVTYSDIMEKFQEFSLFNTTFFHEDIKGVEFDKENVIFPNPNDSNELIAGTSLDAISLLKICYENMHADQDEKMIDDVLSLLKIMEDRITNYKGSRSKDVLSLDGIECESMDIQTDEFLDVFQHKSPTEPSIMECYDDPVENFDFESLATPSPIEISNDVLNTEDKLADISESSPCEELDLGSLHNSPSTECCADLIDNDVVNAEETLPDSGGLSHSDDMADFVDTYVREILESAQLTLDNAHIDLAHSDASQSDLPPLQMSSVISDT